MTAQNLFSERPSARIGRAPRHRQLHRTASAIALATGMIGLAGLGTPAAAQCVEGVPDEYSCSGVTPVGQIIVGDDTSAATTAGFAVDTTANGNGVSLQMTGDGQIAYTDLQASSLTGGGVQFKTTGASGLDAGSLVVFSDGAITANGPGGLILENEGGGDTTAVWTGSVINTGIGAGVLAESEFGSGNLSLTVGDVFGQDDGVRLEFFGGGSLTFVAQGDITGDTDAGLRIVGGATASAYDAQVGEVTGGTWGIIVENNGIDSTRVVATGTVTGLTESGISVLTGPNATDVDVEAFQVNGAISGIEVDNNGSGATTIVASGTVAAASHYGIRGFNQVTATDLSISAVDVFGNTAISASNNGTGSTQIIATGSITAFLGAGVSATNGSNAGDLLIDVADIAAVDYGITASNLGDGATTVRASGSILSETEHGVAVTNWADSTGVVVNVADVRGGRAGIVLENAGSGSTVLTATGQVTGDISGAIYVYNETLTTDLTIDVAGAQGGTHFTSRGIYAENEGSGATFIRASGPVSGSQSGIEAQTGTTTTDLTILAGDAQGGSAGIAATNFGSGDTTVVAGGTVTSDGGRGIDIATGTGSQNVIIEAADVFGAFTGIHVEHEGVGAVSVTTTGVVSAAEFAGIEVTNGSGTDISVLAASVLGGETGISTSNSGSGTTFIGATGPVSGWLFGVSAVNQTGSGALTVEVGDVTSSSGTGIDVVNFGSGLTRVISDGVVTGSTGNGITAQTGTASQNLGVYINEVHGQENGIILENFGAGGTAVAATGDISAVVGSGLRVTNGVGTTEIQIDVGAVDGGDRGIWATSEGLGGVYVNATGAVSGDDFGILAEMGAAGANIWVDVVDVFSAGNGIVAENNGDGFTRVESTGTVIGTDEVGIRAFAGANTFNVIIDANNASGGVSGISAVSFGLGPVEITTHGLVTGGNEGIEAFSDSELVTITNEGTVANASGLSSDSAIVAFGAGVFIFNNGLVIGEIDIEADASLVVNEGEWRTAGGLSVFAGADDALFNQAGAVIDAGVLSGVVETAVWSGLEAFTNSGSLQLADGGAGDQVFTSANAVFEGTSSLTVDIAGAGISDRFDTLGPVEIEPGSLLTISATQPLILNSQYVVVAAAGGVTGEFDFDEQMLTAFAGLRDGYTANTAFVEFVQLKALADVALTPNQEETALGADSLPDGDPVKDALLLLPTDEAAQEAFDLLSGEIHPAARTAMVEDSRLPRTAVLDRLGYGEPERSVWGRVFGSFGTSDGDSNAAELDRDARGMIFGVDKAFGDFTVGVAAGAFETEVDLGARASVATVESVHGLAYAGGRFGAWTVRGGVGYAVTSTDTRREIVFPGFAAVTEADYEGSVLQGFVEAGYRLSLGKGHVEPFVGLTALQVKTDVFAEAGGPAALSGRSRSEQTTVSTVGLRFETSPEGRYSLRGSTGWRHSWGDLDPTGVHAFDGGAPFTILGAAQSADAAFANVEARWKVSPAATFGIAYDGVLGADGEDHAITGSLRVVF